MAADEDNGALENRADANQNTISNGQTASNTQERAQAAWIRVRRELRQKMGRGFDFYAKDLALVRATQSKISLAAPTEFMRQYVNAAYKDTLHRVWAQEMPTISQIEIICDPALAAEAANAPVQDIAPVLAEPDQGWDAGLGMKLDPRYTFTEFVVGKPNEFAYNAARAVSEQNAPGGKPLFLFGGAGLGKTHLMQAIAWELRRRRPDLRVLCLSAERFMNAFIRAIRFKDTFAFKDILRSSDALLIDDVQFICGKDSTQEEFFHTFNALVEGGKQLVFTADRSPIDLDGLEERIKSRLSGGLAVEIKPADYELRLSILQVKAEQLRIRYPDVKVPEKVMDALAHRLIANVRVLEGGLHRIVAHAQMTKREITLDGAQEVLSDLLKASDRKIMIEDIQRKVADYYNIRLADMVSPRRSRAIARPRQIAMYFAKTLTTRSLPEIGRKFGGRDHTTVIHAIRVVTDLRARDAALNEDLTILQRVILG